MERSIGLWRLVLLMAAILVVPGCATRQPALLIPIAEAPEGAQAVDLLAITTRAPSDAIGEIFSGERSREVTGRFIEVSIPPSHQPGNLEWPSGADADPRSHFSTLSIRTPAQEEVWTWFDRQETDGRLLVFVHGYNVRFADAVYRLAQITHDLPVVAAPVLFSWPSRGDLLGYNYDRESATYARDALERVLAEAAKRDSVSQITVLAHSMGSWVTMEALRQSSIRNGRVSPKISDVILAAPDLDIDVFEQQFLALGEERPHFTFLVSADDGALKLSTMLARGEQRLGSIDPSQEPYRSRIESTPGITVIDLSRVAGEGVNHSKFAESGELRAFARDAMSRDGAPASVGSSIGKQAGAVIVTLGLGVSSIAE